MTFSWKEIEGTQMEKRLQDYEFDYDFFEKQEQESRREMLDEAQAIIDKKFEEWSEGENEGLYDIICDMEAELDMISQGLIEIYDFKQDFSEYLEG